MRLVQGALLVAALVLAAPVARATSSRVVGLGDMSRFVEDDTNVLTYPGLLPKYSHFLYVDLAGPGGLSPTLSETQQGELNAGAFLRLSDGLHLGLVTSSFAPGEHAAFLGQVAGDAAQANGATFGALAGATALRRYDLILGYGDKIFGAGLRLAYGSDSKTYVPHEDEKTTEGKARKTDYQSLSQLRLTGGASGELPDGSRYDGGFDYTHYGLDYQKNEEAPFDFGGGNAFGLNGRFRMVLSRYWDLIPAVAYRYSFFNLVEYQNVPGFGPGEDADVKKFDNSLEHAHFRSQHQLDIGAAAALRASKVATFIVGTGVQYSSTYTSVEKTDSAPGTKLDEFDDHSRSEYSLPYLKFGIEAGVLEWLKLRAGAEKFVWRFSETKYLDHDKTEQTIDRSGTIAGAPDFGAYIGATASLGGFALDLLVDNEFLKRGPNFVSGAAGNIAARASLSAKF